MTYGIEVVYSEKTQNGERFAYSQYKEYKTLGKSAHSFVKRFKNFTVDRVTIKNERNETVPNPKEWKV